MHDEAPCSAQRRLGSASRRRRRAGDCFRPPGRAQSLYNACQCTFFCHNANKTCLCNKPAGVVCFSIRYMAQRLELSAIRCRAWKK